jgi:hypothetical protein
MRSETRTAAGTVIMEIIGSLGGYANGRKNIKMLKINVLKCLKNL